MTTVEQNCDLMLKELQKKFSQTGRLSAADLMHYLQKLQEEQKLYQQDLDAWLDKTLQQVFLELQSLSTLLEKANKGQLPPSDEIAELAQRLAALEKTVAWLQSRQAIS